MIIDDMCHTLFFYYVAIFSNVIIVCIFYTLCNNYFVDVASDWLIININ